MNLTRSVVSLDDVLCCDVIIAHVVAYVEVTIGNSRTVKRLLVHEFLKSKSN